MHPISYEYLHLYCVVVTEQSSKKGLLPVINMHNSYERTMMLKMESVILVLHIEGPYVAMKHI